MKALTASDAKNISDTTIAPHPRRSVPSPARHGAPGRRPLGRWFRRETPTTFHRFLAVHIRHAEPKSALDLD